MPAMRSSVLASDISTLSSMVAKSGHSRCACRSSSRSPYSASAVPRPYQPARLMRACDQENTHGMARRSSSDSTDSPRRAGREPIGRRPTSSSGVTSANHCGNPSALTSSWKRWREISSRRDAIVANRSVASRLRRSVDGAEASSVAAATCSMCRVAIVGSP